jgi:hypothetical protein
MASAFIDQGARTMSDNRLIHFHPGADSGNLDKNATDNWIATNIADVSPAWIYTTSEQNEDDLFLSVAYTTSRHKIHRFKQIRERCRQAISKFMHQHK